MADEIQPAAVYGFADPEHMDDRRLADPPLGNYARDGMANAASLERTIADLEGADGAYATSSGMAALALDLLSPPAVPGPLVARVAS
jgi:cystathionine beta-lyase/cystathionine gamma-synthase